MTDDIAELIRLCGDGGYNVDAAREIERLRLENRILRTTLSGAWVDYDRGPGTCEDMREGDIDTYDGKPADHAGGVHLYQLTDRDVELVIKSGISQIAMSGQMCFEGFPIPLVTTP